MTIDHWLTIALIISTLIGPALPWLFDLISHPKPTPETNQPKNRIQRIGGSLKRFLMSPFGLPPFNILLNIYVLLERLHEVAPVTRLAIFDISLAVTGIMFNFLNMALLGILQGIRRQADVQRKFDLKQLDLIRQLLDLIQSQTEPHKSTQGILD